MKLQERKPKFKKYRKKPVVVKAIQWDGGRDVFELIKSREPRVRLERDNLVIPTLEGEMTASLGDFVIFGVSGEPYPCKPDIFWKTYEEETERR